MKTRFFHRVNIASLPPVSRKRVGYLACCWLLSLQNCRTTCLYRTQHSSSSYNFRVCSSFSYGARNEHVSRANCTKCYFPSSTEVETTFSNVILKNPLFLGDGIKGFSVKKNFHGWKWRKEKWIFFPRWFEEEEIS